MRIEELDDAELAALYPRVDRPWLRANFVSSVDGAVAVEGLSAGLSGAVDKRVFRVLRMMCDALLVGAGTFRAENYRALRLDERRRAWRVERGLTAYPQMVIVSSSLELTGPAVDGAVILTTGGARNAALEGVAEVVRCESLAHGIALLHERGLGQILCEGGPRLFGGLTTADLVDELCLTVSPLLVGPGADRIVSGTPHPLRRMGLTHTLTSDDGMLMLRYVRLRDSVGPSEYGHRRE
ncbi:pyrimidine reductase family protein [Allorhizocola rhizosphaerae]|uniref:pyrimidine reductase family protein n=1 Tax=Allorhizocola rhizosphaerae TaxID=1872709 RepID=UPI000E3DF66C|nr:pyrimidine reductase family protein [Allorhizocola rhizosphaerae]